MFSRGEFEDFREVDRSRLRADLPALLRAYLVAARRAAGLRTMRVEPLTVWTVQDALERLGRMVGGLPADGSVWAMLERFLPDLPRPSEPQRRAAMASTLVAGLEMARNGAIVLRQDSSFGPIMLRPLP